MQIQKPLFFECDNAQCKASVAINTRDDFIHNTTSRNTYIIMRHGYSARNPDNILASQYPEEVPYPLLGKGVQDAEDSAQKLKNERIDVIITSPLIRAFETARIVSKAVGVEPSTDVRLCDYNVGVFEGQQDHILRNDPKYSSIAKLFEISPPQGETYTQLRERVLGVLKDCEQNYANKTIVVVSHGDALWLIDSSIRGLTIEETVESRNAGDYIPTGTFQKIKYTEFPYNAQGELDFSPPILEQCKLLCKKCNTGHLKLQ